MQPRLKLFQS